jgi:hypothetical protein
VAEEKFGLLLIMMEPSSVVEEEFNEWYDTEHMPERLSVPGFLSGTRYTAKEARFKYLTLMDLENPEVLKSDAYARISPLNPSPWSRRMFRHIRGLRRAVYQQKFPGKVGIHKEAEGMMLIEEDIDSSKEEEINQWYVNEHTHYLMQIHNVLSIRRFTCIEGSPSFLTIYELSGLELLQDAFFKKAFVDKTMRFGEHITNIIKGIYVKHCAYTFNHISFFK